MVGVYDTLSGQFELPTLRKLVGMSGELLPWWGWLLLLQAIFVAALFEYVRKNVPIQTPKIVRGNDIAKIHVDLETKQKVDEIVEKLEKVRVDGAINTNGLEKLSLKVEAQKNQSLLSFHAIDVRERLGRLEESMNRKSADLYDRLSEGDQYDAERWNSWESCHAAWESDLDKWIEWGRFFIGGDLREQICNVAEHEYNAHWTVEESQFPDADAVRRFKRHRIIKRHWDETRNQVMTGLRQVAFHGLSERDVQYASQQGPR